MPTPHVEPTDPFGEPVMQYGEDRRCKHCNTLLTSYNPNEYCFVHSMIGAKLEDDEKQKKAKHQQEKQRERRQIKKEVVCG